MSRGCKATSIGSDESDSSYMFTAQRYTLYVHEDVNAKVKSCTSTRTIMRLSSKLPTAHWSLITGSACRTFTAQRYTFSVHENVYTKVKSCMSTRTSTRTIMRLQENYPLSTARSFHFNSFDILIITKVLS